MLTTVFFSLFNKIVQFVTQYWKRKSCHRHSPQILPTSPSRNKTLTIEAKRYPKANNKAFQSSPMLVDFLTLSQIFCPRFYPREFEGNWAKFLKCFILLLTNIWHGVVLTFLLLPISEIKRQVAAGVHGNSNTGLKISSYHGSIWSFLFKVASVMMVPDIFRAQFVYGGF